MLGVGRERAQGYATISDPDKGMIECDTFTCNHCQQIVFVRPKNRASDDGAMCKMCMQLICQRCLDDGRCIPFLKKLDIQERQEYIRRSYEG